MTDESAESEMFKVSYAGPGCILPVYPAIFTIPSSRVDTKKTVPKNRLLLSREPQLR